MGEKKEDDEFVLQIAFSFNKFLMYDDTRLALLNYTQVGIVGSIPQQLDSF